MKLLIFLLLFTNSLYALELSLYIGGKNESVKIHEYQNKQINDLCFQNLHKCKALQAVKRPVTLAVSPSISGISPYVKQCQHVGGTSITLKDPLKNEYDYCLFDDLTMILSIDLLSMESK